MIKDSKYIIKRIIIGVLIALILSFINSCNVHAETYGLTNQDTKIRVGYNNYINVNWNENYWRGVAYDTYVGFDSKVELANSLQVLQDGRYLVSFIVWSNQNQPQVSCSNLSSNFKNVNMTTGNWVQNEISSSCVDIYRVTYNNHIAWRLLYEFIYTNKTGSGGITELEFIVNSNNNFFNGDANGLDLGFTISDIQNYDINVINTWNTDKSQQTIISGQQDIIYNQNNNTQSIINNQNTNTNSIINGIDGATQQAINNANQNKQDIINNQNSNTDREIESQQVCNIKLIDKNSIKEDNKYLNDNGDLQNSNTFGTTDFIEINQDTFITLENRTEFDGGRRYCFYNEYKTKISCVQSLSISIGSTLIIPNNAKYIRFTISKSDNLPKWKIQNCKNGNQAMNDSINDVNNSINDSSTASNEDFNDAIDSVNDALPTNSTISSLITMPITFLQKIIDALNGSCSPIIIGELFEYNMTMPCINPSDYIGFIWNIIDIICSGFFAYYFGKKLVLIFHNITSMKEGGLKEAYD